MSIHLVKAPGNTGINLYVNADKVRGKADKVAIAFKVHFDTDYPSTKWHTSELSSSERRIFGEDDPFSSETEITARRTKRGLLAWKFMSDDDKAIAIIADILEGNSSAVTAANHSTPEHAVEEFACEFKLTEENIRTHLYAVVEKVKHEKGNKVNIPEKLAPYVWQAMQSTAEKNNRILYDII
jgi:hypothetical protein